jgi:putative membrane protein
MKTGLAIATTCLLIALPAMAQSRAPRAQEFVNKVAGQRYVRNPIEPVRTHRKQPDKDTKPFAQRMVKDHQKTTAEPKKLVDSGRVQAKLPTAF